MDVEGHTDEVLTLAASSDGRYLVSGGKDRKVGVWDVEKEVWVKGFGGHKDLISVSGSLVHPFFLSIFHPWLFCRSLFPFSLFPVLILTYIESVLPKRHPPIIHRLLRPHRETLRPLRNGLRRDTFRAPRHHRLSRCAPLRISRHSWGT